MNVIDIEVKARALQYPVMIEEGCLRDAAFLIRKHLPVGLQCKKVFLVSDTNVYALYGKGIEDSLQKEFGSIATLLVKPGEASKSLENLGRLYEGMAKYQLSRSDLVVALGGGVVGDLTGFAAATYLRGVPLVQIPTTLLAQVDSSIGGKTAIDLPAGKNLAGAFYQPWLTLIDPVATDTLSDPLFADGMAEVIKTAAIMDRELFGQLEACKNRKGLRNSLQQIIHRCCEIKASVVMQDERDEGLRMILNFGHTLGHAIEKAFDYSGYTHGQAVAIGMVRAARIGETMGITLQGTAERLKEVLLSYSLPVEMPDAQKETLKEAMRLDKKIRDGKLNMILLGSLGKAEIVPVDVGEIERLL